MHAKKLILHTVTAAPALLHLYRLPVGEKLFLALPQAAATQV